MINRQAYKKVQERIRQYPERVDCLIQFPAISSELERIADHATNIAEEVVGMCPTKCMSFDGSALKINDKDCNRCMHCINQMPKALRPGVDKGATIMLGGKAPIVTGALMSWVIVPFMKLEAPYDNRRTSSARCGNGGMSTERTANASANSSTAWV